MEKANKIRQVRGMETSASELLMTCRNESDDAKTGTIWSPGIQDGRDLITVHLASGMKAA